MSYARRQLERDLSRALYRYYLRTGEMTNVDFDIHVDQRVVEQGGTLDTENFRESDVEVTVENEVLITAE